MHPLQLRFLTSVPVRLRGLQCGWEKRRSSGDTRDKKRCVGIGGCFNGSVRKLLKFCFSKSSSLIAKILPAFYSRNHNLIYTLQVGSIPAMVALPTTVTGPKFLLGVTVTISSVPLACIIMVSWVLRLVHEVSVVTPPVTPGLLGAWPLFGLDQMSSCLFFLSLAKQFLFYYMIKLLLS